MNPRASSVESAGRRKTLLGIALLLAQRADPQSKTHQNVGSLYHANPWNVDNEYHIDDYGYHSAFDWDELSCPSGFSGVMAAIVIAELGASTTNTPSKPEHIIHQIGGEKKLTDPNRKMEEPMNTNSMPTPTPGPESNDRHGDLKTPEQRTIAYRLGRALQLRGAVSIGLVVFVVALCFLSALCFDSFVKYDDSEIVGGAIICIVIVGFVILAWVTHRNECDFRRTPADPPAPAPQSNPVPPSTWGWNQSWSSFLAMGFAFYVMNGRSDESRRNGAARIQQQRQYEVGQQARARLLQATMSNWQTSVVNFHQIRFQLPMGDEPAGKFLEDMYNRLRQLTYLAKAAPTAHVDQDLVAMAIRHLAVEDRMIQFKVDVDELMKRDKITAPAGTDTMDQRMTQWQSIVARIDADPSIFDNLPQGPMRTLLETVMELEQQRMDQLREIEIMQAVLQERYPGTKFPLPEVGP